MRPFLTTEIKFIRDNPMMGIQEIADALGRRYNSVYDAIVRYGISRKIRGYQHWTARELRRIHKMREQGMTYSEISKHLGRSAQNCRNAFYRNRKQSIDENRLLGHTGRTT